MRWRHIPAKVGGDQITTGDISGAGFAIGRGARPKVTQGLGARTFQSHSNGLTAGVYGYAGYFWSVTDAGAGTFAKSFYRSLFMRENVCLAFLEARQRAISELGEVGDLSGYSAVLYGDAASKHRRDWATAA